MNKTKGWTTNKKDYKNYCFLCSSYEMAILNKGFGNQPKMATTTTTRNGKKYRCCEKCKKLVAKMNKGGK